MLCLHTHAQLLLFTTMSDPDIGDPGYRAITGFSWQLQEVTATFLAHCPTAVKWHMSPYSWASCRGNKVSDIWNRYWKQQNKRPETKDKNQSCDIIALGNFFFKEVSNTVHDKKIPCVMFTARPAPAQWMHAFTQQNMRSPKCCLVAAVNATCAIVDTLEKEQWNSIRRKRSQWAWPCMRLCAATSMSAP